MVASEKPIWVALGNRGVKTNISEGKELQNYEKAIESLIE